jgi:hypothetical protein
MVRKLREGYVPNAPIREAFIKSGISTYDLASFIGWIKGAGKEPDTTRVERALGLRSYKNGKGESTTNISISEENALKIIEAIHYDPVDFREIGL